MGKLLHTVVTVDEAARKALLALLPAEQQEAYVRALKEQDPALLVVLGERAEVADLNKELEGQAAHAGVNDQAKTPFQPPLVRGELTKELGTFRRETIYD